MIIKSLLDNDQYKFTTQQAILKLGFAAVPVRYKFKCRTEGVDFKEFFDEIAEEIYELSALQLTRDEYFYMKSLPYFEDYYLEFLKQFRFDPDSVDLNLDEKTGEMDIQIRGPWFQRTLFEIPVLSIISQIHGKNFQDEGGARQLLVRKLHKIPTGFEFSEIGTRRRKSFEWQDEVIKMCKSVSSYHFKGTSNLFLAMKHNLTPIGTMPHEWLQAHQQLGYRVADSQKMALENWIKVYRGNLGIALSDVINTDAFEKDFDDPLFYKLFDGIREDSEPEPIPFGMRFRKFYYERKIDPLKKTIIFSNGLDFEPAFTIFEKLKNHIGTAFGIGTKLTNNWPGYKPLNIVIKMVECNGQPVAKISNSPGKGMCESPEYVTYLKSVFEVE